MEENNFTLKMEYMRWVKVRSFECLREEPLHLSTGLSPLRATTISKILAPL